MVVEYKNGRNLNENLFSVFMATLKVDKKGTNKEKKMGRRLSGVNFFCLS